MKNIAIVQHVPLAEMPTWIASLHIASLQIVTCPSQAARTSPACTAVW